MTARMYVLRRIKDGKYWAPGGPGLYSGKLSMARTYASKKTVPLPLVGSSHLEIVRVLVTVELAGAIDKDKEKAAERARRRAGVRR